MANTDRSITDNVPSPAAGPTLRPDLDMAALIESATPRPARSDDEVKKGLFIFLNGEGGMWWA